MMSTTRPVTDLSIPEAISQFLTDLVYAGRSAHTQRAYATDLKQFAATCFKPVAEINSDDLRHFFAQSRHLSSATQARKQNSLASFLSWAYKQAFIETNPMDRLDRIQPLSASPPPISRSEIERILSQIPPTHLRDRLLFQLLFETGLRIGEALSLQIGDLDLKRDDEHLTVLGKQDKRRTILIDDSRLVSLLHRYLKQTSYQSGYLFRAYKNARGGSIRYQSVYARWQSYCQQAGITCTLHQLRHAHATELINDGVSLATIRKRLGHKNLQTTLRYAQQSDAVADAEIRRWRRRKELR